MIKDREYIDSMPIVSLFLKRLFDIIVSFFGLLILSPVFILITLSLLIQGKGSVIFKQKRVGYKGKEFYIYKFRSMKVDAERKGPQLTNCRDYRLTKVGAVLRHSHLDELPQLWNVFIGEMSFVGPRPERAFFIDKILENDIRYTQLYKVRPGITSPATLYNGYTDTMEKMLKRLQMDLDYMENRTLWLDLKIIVKTVIPIVRGKKI